MKNTQNRMLTLTIGLSRIKFLVTDLVLCNGQVHGRAFDKSRSERTKTI